MTDHPVTPPPELVEEWRTAPEYASDRELLTMVSMTTRRLQEIATQAARWGSDQELEACCEWAAEQDRDFDAELRAARRPKPPSLKEQALDAWDRLRNEAWCKEIDFDLDFVRRALEALDD